MPCILAVNMHFPRSVMYEIWWTFRLDPGRETYMRQGNKRNDAVCKALCTITERYVSYAVWERTETVGG